MSSIHALGMYIGTCPTFLTCTVVHVSEIDAQYMAEKLCPFEFTILVVNLD